jgi:hypothetical protein
VQVAGIGSSEHTAPRPICMSESVGTEHLLAPVSGNSAGVLVRSFHPIPDADDCDLIQVSRAIASLQLFLSSLVEACKSRMMGINTPQSRLE